MKLTVLYFASLREALDCASETVEVPQAVRDIAGLRAHLAARGPRWERLAGARNLRAARNQVMSPATAMIADGDEIAFFPPVTGG